jgi:hypothetical protein
VEIKRNSRCGIHLCDNSLKIFIAAIKIYVQILILFEG